jgi:hypothetical protein
MPLSEGVAGAANASADGCPNPMPWHHPSIGRPDYAFGVGVERESQDTRAVFRRGANGVPMSVHVRPSEWGPRSLELDNVSRLFEVPASHDSIGNPRREGSN